MNPNDDCPWKILFNKMEKLEDKMEETRIAVVDIKHVKEDILNHSNRIAKVEKVTTAITVLFKAVLFLMSSAGILKLVMTFSNKLS